MTNALTNIKRYQKEKKSMANRRRNLQRRHLEEGRGLKKKLRRWRLRWSDIQIRVPCHEKMIIWNKTRYKDKSFSNFGFMYLLKGEKKKENNCFRMFWWGGRVQVRWLVGVRMSNIYSHKWRKKINEEETFASSPTLMNDTLNFDKFN